MIASVRQTTRASIILAFDRTSLMQQKGSRHRKRECLLNSMQAKRRISPAPFRLAAWHLNDGSLLSDIRELADIKKKLQV